MVKIISSALFLLHFFIAKNCIAQNGISVDTNQIIIEITFTNMYVLDTVTMKLNEVTLFDKRLVQSDSSDGVTSLQFRLYENGKYYTIIDLYGQKSFCNIRKDGRVYFKFTIYEKEFEFFIEPNKGKFILVENSNNVISLKQLKKRPSFF